MKLTGLFSIFLVSILAGCQTPVAFNTHTSLGLDVSGTAQMPNKVSLSYNRFEGAIVPRKTDGEAHSVYGGMDADIKFFDSHIIKQTFATGKAAMNASEAVQKSDSQTNTHITDQDPLVFVTATTFGLHLTAGEQQMSPNLLMGYRRTEAALIPVPDPSQEVRSVYADLLINSSSNTNGNIITTNFSALHGVRIKQSFATGRAAEALALGDDVKAKLKAAAGVETTAANLRQNKSRAEGIVTDIRSELDRLEDPQLPRAVAESVKTGLITQTDADALMSPGYSPRTVCRKLKGALSRQIEAPMVSKETVAVVEKLLNALREIK